ncbi:MAG: hypothetical protein HY908_12525 [Myxococcales bacterium]|nr:hypothetical protein [Myxococcales bacterium]
MSAAEPAEPTEPAAARESFARALVRRYRATSSRARGLGALWLLFALLVVFKIHGSSLGFLEDHAPDALGVHPAPSYVLGPLAHALGADRGGFGRGVFQMAPRGDRIDEWGVFTPWALAQLSHEPPFPVVNTNIGGGQNMLLEFANPVWHPTALARPSTWGYFFLGAERGLAWAWWFQPFACFTVLFLLFEELLRGDRKLAAFGAFWFSASAYVVCWSVWPAYSVFFPTLLCLAAHRLVVDERRWVVAVSAVALGLGVPGFLMCLYPPWQVPLVWLYLCLLGWMLWRDGALRRRPTALKLRLGALGLALALAAGLVALYVKDTLPAVRAMMGTVYPGSRFHAGGDYGLAWLLRGYFNGWTNFVASEGFHNACEAASFIHLYPSALLVVALSQKRRRAFGGLGWLLTGYVAFALVYSAIGFPRFLATVTLMGRSHPPRVDIAVGLVSVLLCLWLLRRPEPAPDAGEGAVAPAQAARGPWPALERLSPALVGVASALLAAGVGAAVRAHTGSYPTVALGIGVSAAVGAMGYALAARWRTGFMALVAAAVLVTGATFNPLAVGAGTLLESELVARARALGAERRPGDERPLWLCYDPPEAYSVCGQLLAVAGVRSLSGVHQYPHLDLWRTLDPERAHDAAYNRYAHVELVPSTDRATLTFQAPAAQYWGAPDELPPNVFRLAVAPEHAALAALGARYAVAVGPLQADPAFADLRRIYASETGGFSIYELGQGSP